MSEIQLRINGESTSVDVDPHRPLRDVLRQEVGLTGTKASCDSGYCGACTVLVDGDATKSCLVPVGKVAGEEVTTIEGLGSGDDLCDTQRSFVDCFASQCGYCMPGLVVATEGLLEANPSPTDEEIREGISGNICRCTGYVKIIDAIKDAAEAREETQ